MIKIPFNKPYYNDEEERAVAGVLKTRWTTLGKETKKMEEEFAKFVGTKYAIGTSSCTMALTMALKANGIQPGDEVIVPSLTFVASVFSIIYAGAKPVFADIDKNTLCITNETIEPHITRKTKAVLPVHLYGYPTEIDFPLVIEDCAHSIGSYYNNGNHVGTKNTGCFSFHTLKSISCGDGGMITTNNSIHYKILKEMRWFGATKDTYTKGNNWQYDIHFVGEKGYLNDLSASIARIQLKRTPEFLDKKRKIAKNYREAFKDIEEIQMYPQGFEDRTSCLTCAIRVENRDDMMNYLYNKGIGTSVHYRPVHLYSFFGNEQQLPVTEKEWEKILCIPSYYEMTELEQEYVIDSIKSYLI